jgi:hypothetical protein
MTGTRYKSNALPQFLTINLQFTSHNHSHILQPTIMVFPAPYPCHSPRPQTFSVQQDPQRNSTAQWSQVEGYAQPEPVEGINFDFESLDFESLDALIDWERGIMRPQPSPDPLLGQDFVSVFILMPKYVTNIYLRVLTAPPQWPGTCPGMPLPQTLSRGYLPRRLRPRRCCPPSTPI